MLNSHTHSHPHAAHAAHAAKGLKHPLTAIAITAGLLLTAGTPAAQANTLDAIPGPDDTGGMVMPMVGLDFDTQAVSIHMHQGSTVPIYSLQQYLVNGSYPYADAVFNPALAAEPWYDLLDPTAQHLPFSNRFGFMLSSGNAHLIPLGSYVFIKATDVTEGLKIYDLGHRGDDWGQEPDASGWHQVFGEGNFGGTLSPELDNVAVWGDSESIKMWHPIALVPSEGLYSARFEFYLGDGNGHALDGWTSASITLHWDAAAVPEPRTTALLVASAMAAATLLRRRKRTLHGTALARKNADRNPV